METFLPPIEKPKSPVIRLAYAVSRKQFGKVLTPLKVMYVRLPTAFGVFVSKIAKLDRKLQLSPELAMLIRERVAQLNVCAFCVDIGRAFAIKAAMNQAKFDALDEYATSPLFNDAERAALNYVTELTRDRNVNPMTFARMAGHYSERAACEIVWLVASEHFYNITNNRTEHRFRHAVRDRQEGGLNRAFFRKLKAQRLVEALPAFASELQRLTIDAERADLAEQIPELCVVDRRRCGDDFCATFHTQPKPKGSYGPGHSCVELKPNDGTIILDVVSGKIVSVDVLFRDDVRDNLQSILP